jgi:L-threonylcarbamoyladenylate synthase
MALELLSQLDFPLAAPSANPSEYVSPTTAQHVEDQLSKKIKYVLDGGPCTIGLESTIVDLSRDKVRLLRLGAISKEQIEDCLGEEIDDLLLSDNILAPGMMKRHYATSHKIIFEEKVELPSVTKKTIAIRFNKYSPLLPENQQIILSKDSDLYEAASKLFAALRELDKLDVDFIIAEKFPNETIGRAINDRLSRAAHTN